MASWLRAAEELFEVVDRTAKQVVPGTDIPLRKTSSTATGREKTTSRLLDNETSHQPAKGLSKGSSSGQGVRIDDRSNGLYAGKSPENEVEVASGDESLQHVNCDITTENGVVTVKLLAGAEEPVKQPKQSSMQEVSNETEEEKLEEEGNGLLRSESSSVNSKEARLAKICAGLSSRLQEARAENAQLEELLQHEKESRSSTDSMLNQLQEELALARSTTNAVESEMAAALMSKNAEIEVLQTNVENYRRQAQKAEEKLALVQTEMQSVMQNRDITESRMIQTLRQELVLAERRAEEERTAHSNTRMAAVERETELEQRMAESTAAVMRMQKIVDERSQRASDLEQKNAMLEIECATLNQEIQTVEFRVRREQKRQPEEISQNAWREEAERARLAQREAESKLALMEAECQKLRVDMASAKRDSDISSTQAHMELEKRFRDLTELLYLKQTQLETMASEKAAALLQLEKESKRFREAKAEVERSRRQFSTIGDDDDNGLRSFESLGLQQRRMVAPSLQTAAKFLDSGVAQTIDSKEDFGFEAVRRNGP